MEYFDYNKSDILGKLWDLLETEIFLVLDEEGVNMANAKVREIDGEGHWLYVDNVDGFEILNSEEVECLTLEPYKSKPKSPVSEKDMVTLQYWQLTNGDIFVIKSINGMFSEACGPLIQEDVTQENLEEENFEFEKEDIAWLNEQYDKGALRPLVI